MTAPGAIDGLRPFLWLLLAALLTGLASYLALGRPTHAAAQAQPRFEAVSGPASEDWNLPKHI